MLQSESEFCFFPLFIIFFKHLIRRVALSRYQIIVNGSIIREKVSEQFSRQPMLKKFGFDLLKMSPLAGVGWGGVVVGDESLRAVPLPNLVLICSTMI